MPVPLEHPAGVGEPSWTSQLARMALTAGKRVDPEAQMHFTLGNDPARIPALVDAIDAEVRRLNLCDASGAVLVSVALHEALTNAMLHGNLEVSSALRETDEKEFYRLAAQRRGQAPYRDRKVHVTARFGRDELTFTVRDEGQGFDPSALPDPTDPANLAKASGRGLLLIRAFMDRVQHNAAGNEITLSKRLAWR